MVQFSLAHMTTGKTITLTRWTFVRKVMSLLFNMLSRFVIAFLPWNKHLLFPLLQSPSTVILKPKKIKLDSVSTFSPSICHEVMGPDTMILVFLMFSFKPHSKILNEIKRSLLLGRKDMTNLDSILKSRDITFPTKVHLVKAIVFLVVMFGCQSWTIRKAECRRIAAFELWCWRRLLRIPWTARRFNQSILKEISPEYSLEELMLKLKLQYLGHLM